VVDPNAQLVYRRPIDNSGDMLGVTLERAGYLDVRVEGLAFTDRGDVRVFDDAGRQLLHPLPLPIPQAGTGSIGVRRWRRVIGLPPGGYTIEVSGQDGSVWRHAFDVSAGETTGVTLQ